MISRIYDLGKKFFAPGGIERVRRRLRVMAIAHSVVRVNPWLKFVSYQPRLRRFTYDERHTAIVVGAGGGIGEAVARRFLKKGCKVVGTYRRHHPALQAGGRLELFRMDITSVIDVNQVYTQLRGMGVKADVIVVATGFNSGLDYHASFEDDAITSHALEQEREDLLRSFEGNTLGPYLVIRRFAALIPNLPSSHLPVPQICMLSSSLGTMNNELYGGMYGYRTGKGALHALAMAMYCDLNLARPVGVQILGPGNVATRMNVGGRISPDEAAQEIIRNMEYSARKPRFQFLGVGGKRIAW